MKPDFDDIYYIDAQELCDWLNKWYSTDKFKPTQHGESIYYGDVKVFSRWDKWREEVGYYYDSFFNEADNRRSWVKEVFLYEITGVVMGKTLEQIVGPLEEAPGRPKEADNWLFL